MRSCCCLVNNTVEAIFQFFLLFLILLLYLTDTFQDTTTYCTTIIARVASPLIRLRGTSGSIPKARAIRGVIGSFPVPSPHIAAPAALLRHAPTWPWLYVRRSLCHCLALDSFSPFFSSNTSAHPLEVCELRQRSTQLPTLYHQPHPAGPRRRVSKDRY